MSNNRATFFVLLHNQRSKFFLRFAHYLASLVGHEVIIYSNRHIDLQEQEVNDKKIHVRSLRYQQLVEMTFTEMLSDHAISLKNTEKQIGFPFKRVLLTDERKAGVAFRNNTWVWFWSPFTRMMAKNPEMANNLGTAAFKFWQNEIERYNPKIIFSGSNSGLFNGALFFAARSKRVKILTNRRSKILDGRYYWTSDWFEQNTKSLAATKSKIDQKHAPARASQEFYSNFKQSPTPVKYIQENWANAAAPSAIRRLRTYAGALKATTLHLIGITKGDKPVGFLKRLAADISYFINKRFAKRYFKSFKKEDLLKFRYVYFSMHKEPEVALNQHCPSMHDQSQLVRWVAANLPEGFDLVVKEHRFNHGRRSPKFYKTLSRLPNVVLVDGYASQYDLIKNSSLVLAITGSAGYEAMIFERPMIYMGPTFYDFAQNGSRVCSMEELASEIFEKLTEEKESVCSSDFANLCILHECETKHTWPEPSESSGFSCDLELNSLIAEP